MEASVLFVRSCVEINVSPSLHFHKVATATGLETPGPDNEDPDQDARHSHENQHTDNRANNRTSHRAVTVTGRFLLLFTRQLIGCRLRALRACGDRARVSGVDGARIKVFGCCGRCARYGGAVASGGVIASADGSARVTRQLIGCRLRALRACGDRARVSGEDGARIKVFGCCGRCARYGGARPLRGIVLIRMLLRGTISARQSIACQLRAKRALACSVVTVLVESRSACIAFRRPVGGAVLTVVNKTVVTTKSIRVLVIACVAASARAPDGKVSYLGATVRATLRIGLVRIIAIGAWLLWRQIKATSRVGCIPVGRRVDGNTGTVKHIFKVRHFYDVPRAQRLVKGRGMNKHVLKVRPFF